MINGKDLLVQSLPKLRGLNGSGLFVDQDLSDIGGTTGMNQRFILLLWGKTLNVTVIAEVRTLIARVLQRLVTVIA